MVGHRPHDPTVVLPGGQCSRLEEDTARSRSSYAGPVDRFTRPRWGDAALALAVAVVGLAEIWVPLPSVMGTGSPTVATGIVLVLGAALTQRRTHPLAAAVVVLLTWPLVSVVTPVLVLFWGAFVPILVALYSVARHGSPRQRWVGAGVGAGTLLFFDLRVPELGDPSEIVFHWLVSTVAFALGAFVASYERRARLEAERAVRAEHEGREQARRAAEQERARIARELHDIVAHSVSVMVVQAGAAEKAIDDPEYVRRALAAIRGTGTEALAEMRRVVALIRDSDDDAGLRPQPDLTGLEDLVAGMDVPTRLRVEGAERPLPAGVGLAVFRIVQEALTNVRRHAQATSVEVCLRYEERCLEIEVHDDGTGVAAAGNSTGTSTGSSGGHGLVGMRERVQMYGGSLATIAEPGAGFRVRAVLPLDDAG